MTPRKQNPKKEKSLVTLEFQLSEMVFDKQKGYAPWPAIITSFHPQKPRCAKVEFFAWNQQWTYISFNKLLKIEAGKLIAETHPNNVQLQKAVREMEFVFSMARPLCNDRVRENGFDVAESSQIHSSTESNIETIGKVVTNAIRSNSKINTVGQSESNQNKDTSQFNETIRSSQEINHIRTRSQCQPISNNFPNDVGYKTSQPISIKSKIAKVGRSDLTIEQLRGTKSQDQALTNLETLNRNQTRSQIRKTSKINETDKPAAKRMRTRSQGAKKETNAKTLHE